MSDAVNAPNWRDLLKRQAAAPAAPPPPSPALERLLAERRELEARMAALTGAPIDPHAAKAFPVQPMAERRRAHERWEAERDARAAAAAERTASRREAAPSLMGDAPAPLPEPVPGGTPTDPRGWYAARDADLGAERERRVAGSAELLRQARERRLRDQADFASDARPEPPAADRPRPVDANAVFDARRRRAIAAREPLAADPAPPLRSLDRPRPAPPPKPAEKVAMSKAPSGERVRPAAKRDRGPAKPAPAPAERPAAPAARVKPPADRDRAPARRTPAERPFGADLRRAVVDTLSRPMVRDAARSGLGETAGKLGAERLAKPKTTIEKVVAKSKDALARADGAGRKIEDAWAKRRDQSFGPDLASYARGYDERKARLLGVDTGSLNDLAQRTEAQRQSAIARRADSRRSEAADAQRRERALERRKAGRSEA